MKERLLDSEKELDNLKIKVKKSNDDFTGANVLYLNLQKQFDELNVKFTNLENNYQDVRRSLHLEQSKNKTLEENIEECKKKIADDQNKMGKCDSACVRQMQKLKNSKRKEMKYIKNIFSVPMKIIHTVIRLHNYSSI